MTGHSVSVDLCESTRSGPGGKISVRYQFRFVINFGSLSLLASCANIYPGYSLSGKQLSDMCTIRQEKQHRIRGMDTSSLRMVIALHADKTSRDQTHPAAVWHKIKYFQIWVDEDEFIWLHIIKYTILVIKQK